jgi:peptidyl-prolyl cis-trans isomerase C
MNADVARHAQRHTRLRLVAGSARRASAVILSMALATPATARTLAVVDGQAISEDALKRSAKALGPRADMMLGSPTLRRQYLESLIDAQLMAKAAAKSGLNESPRFKELVAEAEAQILASLYVDDYLQKHLNDTELKQYFAREASRYSDQEVHVAHIVASDEAKARALLELLKGGADFATLAKGESQGPSAPYGGDLGFIGRGRMVPEFEKAMFSTPKGTVHPVPVKSPFGYHLIKVIDVRGKPDAAYEDVAAKVKEDYATELKTRLVAKLRSKAKVKIDEDAIRTFGN